jgi:hypothetical protein
MFSDLRDRRRFMIRFNVTPDKFINSPLFCAYWHNPSPLPGFSSNPKINFQLTSENRANILEHMRRDVKSFLSHRGFSPVILLRRLTSFGVSRTVSDGGLLENHSPG